MDRRQRFRLTHALSRETEVIRAGLFHALGLRHGTYRIGGINVCHRLDAYRVIASQRERANPHGISLAPTIIDRMKLSFLHTKRAPLRNVLHATGRAVHNNYPNALINSVFVLTETFKVIVCFDNLIL